MNASFMFSVDTFILPPAPLSSFQWQATREIVFFTFPMKAAQSRSLLSGLPFGSLWRFSSFSLHMLIPVHDICLLSDLENGPFTKCNNKINPPVRSERERKGQYLTLQAF